MHISGCMVLWGCAGKPKLEGLGTPQRTSLLIQLIFYPPRHTSYVSIKNPSLGERGSEARQSMCTNQAAWYSGDLDWEPQARRAGNTATHITAHQIDILPTPLYQLCTYIIPIVGRKRERGSRVYVHKSGCMVLWGPGLGNPSLEGWEHRNTHRCSPNRYITHPTIPAMSL